MRKKTKKFVFGLLAILLVVATILGVRGAPFDDVPPQDPTEDQPPTTDYGKISLSTATVRIDYLENIKSNKSLIVINSAIKLEKDKITVMSELYPELDRPAKLTFIGTFYSNPIACWNGICDRKIKVVNEGKNTYSIVVNHFSTWQLTDNTWNGTFYNTSAYTTWPSDSLGLSPFSDYIYDFDFAGFPMDSSYYSLGPQFRTVGATFTATGIKDGAYTYDGVSQHQINTSNMVGINYSSDNWTISIWANATNMDTTSRGIITNRYPNDAGSQFWILGKYGNNVVLVVSHSDGTNHFLGYQKTNNPVNQGWINYIIRKNESNISFYMNGSYVNSTIDPNPNFGSGKAFRVGDWTATGINIWNGTIDELRIIKRAISPGEIAYLSNISNSQLEHYVYPAGYYVSEIYNSSDYDPTIWVNHWNTIATTPNTSSGIDFYGRAGDCGTVTSEGWTQGSYNGVNWSLTNVNGKCFQYQAYLYGNTSYMDLYYNVTIESFKINFTNISLTNWFPTTQNFTINEPESQYFWANVSDPGGLGWTTWYFDGVIVRNVTTNMSNITFVGSYESQGTHNITVAVDNGMANDSFSWYMTVQDQPNPNLVGYERLLLLAPIVMACCIVLLTLWKRRDQWDNIDIGLVIAILVAILILIVTVASVL